MSSPLSVLFTFSRSPASASNPPTWLHGLHLQPAACSVLTPAHNYFCDKLSLHSTPCVCICFWSNSKTKCHRNVWGNEMKPVQPVVISFLTLYLSFGFSVLNNNSLSSWQSVLMITKVHVIRHVPFNQPASLSTVQLCNRASISLGDIPKS